jgi:hypothetical protein
VGNAWRHFRQHGLIATLRTIIDRHVYHSRRYIITYNVLETAPGPDRIGDVIMRLATPADLDRLGDLEPYGRGATTHRPYVEHDRDWLFVACHGDRIVATRRVSRVVRDGVMSRVVRLGAHQLWAADVFCVPEFRNRGIGRRLQLFGNRYLGRLGYTELFGAIAAANTASIRASLGAETRLVYSVAHLRILSWERVRVSEGPPGPLYHPRTAVTPTTGGR